MLERPESERTLSRVVAVARKWWWVVAAVALIGGGGAYLLAKQEPDKYSATAALLFQNSNLDQKLFGYQVIESQDPTRTAATNQALVELPTVAADVAQTLHMSSQDVKAAVAFGSDATSDVFTVTATSKAPRLAARIANAYVAQYVRFREIADRSQLAQAQGLVTSQLGRIGKQQANSSLAQSLRERAFQLKLLSSLQTGDAEVVQRATVPTSPSSPTPVRDAAIGLILGLLVGCGLLAVLARRDQRIDSIDDVEAVYQLPVIGTVPASARFREGGAEGGPVEQDAFRMTRAQLRYFDIDRETKSLMVTSADASEGKSLVALNLVRAMNPRSDERVLLIEADLRRPSLGETLGIAHMAGLSELVAHPHEVAEGLKELVVTPENFDGSPAHFDVLLSGGTPPNPSVLLESKRTSELLAVACSLYDIVVIDTPPIRVVSDALPLVHQVDGIVVVARLGVSRRDHATAFVKQLRGLNASVLGVVVNGVTSSTDGYYRYGYASRARDSSGWRALGGARRQRTRTGKGDYRGM